MSPQKTSPWYRGSWRPLQVGFYALAALLPFAAACLAQTTITTGALIKNSYSSTLYYISGTDRYVFPNDKIYFSWYKDFSKVVVVSDATLATFHLRGNVTYKPSTRLVKVQSDSKVYAVSRCGTLHGLASESVATSLFGTKWNSVVDDLSSAFFINYTIGSPIVNTQDFTTDLTVQTITDNLTCGSGVTPPAQTNTNVPVTNTNIPLPTNNNTNTVVNGGSTAGFALTSTHMAGNCPYFPSTNPWNTPVDDTTKYPALSNSKAMMDTINQYAPFINTTSFSPITTIVDDTVGLNSISCDASISWCKTGAIPGGATKTIQWPYPTNLVFNSKSTQPDHHAFVIHETTGGPLGVPLPPGVDFTPPPGQKNCFLYETWWTTKTATGFTSGGFSAFDLRRDINFTPALNGGASAADASVSVGAIRYDEAASGNIPHALVTTVVMPQYAYIAPANNVQLPPNCNNFTPTNTTGAANLKKLNITAPCDPHNPNYPPMGQRFRLRATFDETPFANAPMSLAIIHALKKYGAIVGDGSVSSLGFINDEDTRWLQHQGPKDLSKLTTYLSPYDFDAIFTGTPTLAPINVPNSKLLPGG